MIAGRQGTDRAADGMDHAGTLVAVNRRIGRSEIAVAAVQIGLAHAARHHPDDHFVRARIAKFQFIDGEGSRAFTDHGGGDLHSKLSKPRAKLSTPTKARQCDAPEAPTSLILAFNRRGRRARAVRGAPGPQRTASQSAALPGV